MIDEELNDLIVSEVDRYLQTVLLEPTIEVARRAAHAMRGSLGLVGEREAASGFSRLERRLSNGDSAAIGEVRDLLEVCLRGARAGGPLTTSVWPEPPADLRPSAIPTSLVGDYIGEVRSRLLRIDDALLDDDDDYALDEIYRQVHTLKGAALSASDEVMSWFCHGLEERLKAGRPPEGDPALALSQIRSYRGVLSELLDAPENALATLRLLSGVPVRASRPPQSVNLPLPPKRPTTLPDSRPPDDEGLRVASGTLERLLEHASNLTVLKTPLSASAEHLSSVAEELRHLHWELREALRLIGPPKPWGAPARAIEKLQHCAERLLPLSKELANTEDRVLAVRDHTAEQTEHLSSTVQHLRTVSADGLFGRLEQHVVAEARRVEKQVIVEWSGAETPMDRRLFDSLLEPLRQLGRNAVVHGLESAADRELRGKSEIGHLKLAAEERAGSLILTVSDDGAGVDLAAVRGRAVAVGLVSAATADSLSDPALLTLLFYPGFSMRQEVDVLAGRGVGLDLTLAAVHRLGGSVHLESVAGQGLTATVVVPASRGISRVVWVRARGRVFALPAANAQRIVAACDVPPEAFRLEQALPEALGQPTMRPTSPAIVVNTLLGHDEILVAVDAVDGIDDVVLRPLPAFIRTTGPFAGAIAWGEEVRLSIDPLRLVQLASG